MEVLFSILASTFFVSLIAFIGVVILFLKEEFLNRILLILVAFAAGALLGSAFLHLLPEAIEEVGSESNLLIPLFLFVIVGFFTFYILEHFIGWHHHHVKEHPEIYRISLPEKREKSLKPFGRLILISDGLHNFIDGLIIAGSYTLSLPLGIITTLAIALHEIPQEIGDFGVLIYSGFKKTTALFLNFFSGILAILGGIMGFFLTGIIDKSMVFLLPFAAGSFIYIASSDLIPEIKQKTGFRKSFFYFFIFLIGILLMFMFTFLE
jgi:zinc and cadmium transporter